MWVRFPEGTTAISIERQQFASEVQDPAGRHYVRVPDHLVIHALATNMGFHVMEPPDTDLEDLPKEDPERDGMIESLTKKVSVTEEELGMMRTDMAALVASHVAMGVERDGLKAKVEELEAKIREMEDDLDEDQPLDPTAVKKRK
jgi:hypothetical protein